MLGGIIVATGPVVACHCKWRASVVVTQQALPVLSTSIFHRHSTYEIIVY